MSLLKERNEIQEIERYLIIYRYTLLKDILTNSYQFIIILK